MDDQRADRESGGRRVTYKERENPNAPTRPNVRGFIGFLLTITGLAATAFVSFQFEYGYLVPAAAVAVWVLVIILRFAYSKAPIVWRITKYQVGRIQFTWRLNVLLIIFVAVYAATCLAWRDLRWELSEPTRAAAKWRVIELQNSKMSWERDAREQNRLHEEEGWFQRLFHQSIPYSEKEIQDALKSYDDSIAEAEEKVREQM